MTALELSWCNGGETISVEAINGRAELLMVLSNCGGIMRAYHCVPCGRGLANPGQIVLHAADGGVHRIVTWCSRHRVYEEAEQSQRDGFAQIQAASW
jgi:hypothetical protein